MSIIEIHMLKNYGVSNLNRDENGAPKTAVFGGVTRGRISSQCLKASWRSSDYMKVAMDGNIGVRTRQMPIFVHDALVADGIDEKLATEAQRKLNYFGEKAGNDENKKRNETATDDVVIEQEEVVESNVNDITKQCLFYGPEELDMIVAIMKKAILENAKNSLKEFKKLKLSNIFKNEKEFRDGLLTSLDIALFGRMSTSSYMQSMDSALQVAHAISSHEVYQESDFFTAMDNMLDDKIDPGAGMMGDVDFNSCCYYEYVNVDLRKLNDNLKDKDEEEKKKAIKSLVVALMNAIAFSHPSGKQNSFACFTLPGLIVVEVKDDAAITKTTFTDAFREPVQTDGIHTMLMKDSITKIASYVDRIVDGAYSIPHKNRFWFSPEYPEIHPESCDIESNFQKMLQKLVEAL